MIITRQRANYQQGFTIVELMIATTVFAIILLIVSFGLISLGNLYVKGVTNSRTQEVARTIMDEASRAVQFEGGAINPLVPVVSSTGYCVGEKHFVLRQGHRVESADDHGMVTYTSWGTCSGSAGAVSLESPLIPGNARELLTEGMRVSDFKITNTTGNLWEIRVTVASGTNDDLDNPTSAEPKCKGGAGAQFCSVAELVTVVQKRVE